MPSFDQRIARARELARRYAASREILEFYAALAEFQKRIFERVIDTGQTRVESLAGDLEGLVEVMRRHGPQGLWEPAARIEDPVALVADCWNGEFPEHWFFGRALVQPFAEALATRGSIDAEWSGMQCPFCGSRPGVAVLRGEGDGGKRSLECSLCATEWAFRRILCPNCGEEDKDKLPVYAAPEFKHVRVEACDGCQMYIKAVDLTVDGHAVAVVDEVATVALNIWAEERGYVKIAPNAVGM